MDIVEELKKWKDNHTEEEYLLAWKETEFEHNFIDENTVICDDYFDYAVKMNNRIKQIIQIP